MALDLAKFIARFVDEARDHIEKLNKGLVDLEKDPDDMETINSVFRSAHTIKGSSRMLKLMEITEVAHRLEDVLGALREKKVAHSRALADLLFKGIDVISALVDKAAAGEAMSMDTAALCEELVKASEGQLAAAAVPERPSPPAAEPRKEAPASDKAAVEAAPPAEAPRKAEAEAKGTETIRIKADKLDELIKLMGEIVSNQNRIKQRMHDVRELSWEAKRHLDAAAQGAGGDLAGGAQAIYGRTRQLLSASREDTALQELLVADLQEKALVMRMVPLSTIFDSLHRTVRDIARSLGKAVDFSVEGGEIELDRKMMEQLGDPLLHMLRNAIDHGIEDGRERAEAGKPASASLKLSACYDAGSVLIEVSDDGRGVSLERIREKALRRKMFSEEALGKMSEQALMDLIFLPGFSTSAIITDISGRGVGLDVVRKNIIEGLKGTIKVDTKDGRGASFYIRLPLSLAIMRVLFIKAGGVVFGIAAHYVGEILRTSDSEFINVVDKKALRLREEFIPVVPLGGLLKVGGNGGGGEGGVLILIVQIGSEKLGVIVDELLDEENMVIKSLPPHMGGVQLVSGVTISGRNELINILDVPAVMEAARKVGEARYAGRGAEEAAVILVVDDSVNTREIEKNILEAYGYRVDIAGDGVEALEKAKAFKYDLVVTDVEMPRLDGFSLTERLRADDSYRDTPIVIVTSREKEEDKRRGVSVGADAYIVKGSFDQSNLLETVQNLIG